MCSTPSNFDEDSNRNRSLNIEISPIHPSLRPTTQSPTAICFVFLARLHSRSTRIIPRSIKATHHFCPDLRSDFDVWTRLVADPTTTMESRINRRGRKKYAKGAYGPPSFHQVSPIHCLVRASSKRVPKLIC
jgi:hypothetical protein